MPRKGSREQEPETTGVYDPALLPQHQRRRRQSMIQAAIELIERDAYEAIQIRDVAERAGVALGTLYRYFSSKDHLYAAALIEWSSGIVPHLRAPGAEAKTDEERLRSLLRRVVLSFERWPQMMLAEMVLETSSDPNAQVLLDQFSRQYENAMRATLRDMSPKSVDAVGRLISSVTYRELRSWSLGRSSIKEVNRNAQRAVDLIFSGPPS